MYMWLLRWLQYWVNDGQGGGSSSGGGGDDPGEPAPID